MAIYFASNHKLNLNNGHFFVITKALKVYNREKNLSRSCRILAERTILQALNDNEHKSPYIMKYYDSNKDDTNLYLEIELVLGGSLNKHLSHSDCGRFPLSLAVGYFSEAVTALTHIQACGWVHRDLKLSNILLDSHVRLLFVVCCSSCCCY